MNAVLPVGTSPVCRDTKRTLTSFVLCSSAVELDAKHWHQLLWITEPWFTRCGCALAAENLQVLQFAGKLDAQLLLWAECNALQHNCGCEHCAGAVLILRPAVGLSNAAEVVWCLTVLEWERKRCEAWQGVINFVMQSIHLDKGWRLGSLFIMHAFEYLENSSVNHTSSVRAALVFGHFTFRRSYSIFWGDNFKFHNVASACGFVKVKRWFALEEEKFQISSITQKAAGVLDGFGLHSHLP